MTSLRNLTLAAVFGTAGLLPTSAAFADQSHSGEPVTIVAADPTEQPGTAVAGTAQRLRDHRPKPFSPMTAILKAEATAAAGAHAPASQPPITILGGLNFAGQQADTANTQSSPPDNAGAIGPGSYIQTLNTAVRIYNRSTHATIASGSLNQLANNAKTVDSFAPEIIWDPTTNRFYYVMDSIFSNTDNRIAFGFSKSASPTNMSTGWCRYSIKYGTPFPDFPKLGDSKDFILIGTNVYADNDTGGFNGSDIVAISKPAGTGTISSCPAATSFKQAKNAKLKDSGGNLVFAPVPSNQIDDNATGYAVAVDSAVVATKLWFYNVTKSSAGAPLFGLARSVTVPAYRPPPNVGETNGRYIDTSDGRNTQAVQAIDPSHKSVQAFYTQHTVQNGTVASVRWYEIDPSTATPIVLRTGLVAQAGVNTYNAAIAPDRANNMGSAKFGNSFVIQYNAASATVFPRILAVSSKAGGSLSAPTLIKGGVGPYLDFTCASFGEICRWGDYAAATPDPKPTAAGSGVVWGTNQFSGVLNPSTQNGNWRTQIFAIQP